MTSHADGSVQADEPQRVAERYRRRVDTGLYNPLRPEVMLGSQERQRRIARIFRAQFGGDLSMRTALEIGCGHGGNLLELLALGFSPECLTGNELLPHRISEARERLPQRVRLIPGDAMQLPVEPGTFDVVYQSTVFSSILDADFRSRLARRMWEWVRPGGGVLWYDLAFDNPSNPDVRGVRIAEIRRLFPTGSLSVHRVTLAPPLARRVVAIHPALYSLLNAIPMLRTHRLCWIAK